MFAHLVRLSPGFFTERRTGELTSRLSADLAVLQSLMSTWISEMSRQILFLIGGIVLLTLTHPRLTTTTLAVVPIVVAAAFVFGRRLRKASTGVQDRSRRGDGERRRSVLADSHGAELSSRSRRDAPLQRASRPTSSSPPSRRAKLRAMFFGIVGFVAFAGVVAVLWEGGQLVLDGALTPGALVSFLLYAITVAAAVGSLASLFGSYQEALGAASRVFELLDMTATVAEPAQPKPLAKPVRGDVAARQRRLRLFARPARRSCTTSRCTSRRAKSWRSSGRRAPARRRSRRSFRASGT